MGILSTAAFAKDPYGLKPVSNSDLSLTVPFNGNTADPVDYNPKTDTTPASYNAVSFDVVLKDSTGAEVTTKSATIDTTSGKASVVFAKGVLTPGDTYSVSLYHTTDTAHATLLSKSSAVVYDPSNADMYKAGTDANGNPINSTHVDVTGSGYKNANLTGYDNTRKNRSGQKVHGFYQNNTNSCASCHQTHTAANGESLLFKDGVYSTCSACHDGTTGAYNSFAPVSADMTSSIDGTFNVQTAGHNGSLHEADGSLKVSAAPGGNKLGGQYDQEFDCASCHAAHGSGSAGENNLNTDPMGWGSTPYASAAGQKITYFKGHSMATITTTIDNKNGKLFTFANADIVNGVANIPTTETFPYILVKTSLADQNAVNANFFYKRALGTVDTTKTPFPIQVIQTYRWAGDSTTGSYVADYSLWNREEGYPFVANTVLKDVNGKSLNMDPNLQVVYRDAFAYGSAVANIDSAVVSIGIDVETTGNIADLYDSTRTATFVPDSGTEMSKYCASCHVDYASNTRTDNTGVYTLAHRHATLQDKLTCVRCHYAHGSEAQIMHDANDNTYFDLTAATKVFDASVTGNTDKAISYFADPNPSSALKRYTGMSVCYACHGKGEQFIGSNSDKADTITGEFLKGGDPGAARTVISK
ncbi:MAG: cytochrome c3 family protein [Bacillota bacterium]|nr:cytochrome c3 family protein [Bacillota bacterium]